MPQYREHRPGQSYDRPVLYEYAPITPALPTAMTYMVVELVSSVHRPELAFTARPPAEIDHLYRTKYHHMTRVRTPAERALADRVRNRRNVLVFGRGPRRGSGSRSSGDTIGEVESTELVKREAQQLKELEHREDRSYHGVCADWCMVTMTMDIPVPLNNVRMTWTQVIYHSMVGYYILYIVWYGIWDVGVYRIRSCIIYPIVQDLLFAGHMIVISHL